MTQVARSGKKKKNRAKLLKQELWLQQPLRLQESLRLGCNALRVV